MKTILFYGDSNTWGYDPATGGRYAYEERWTTICAKRLGPDFNCIPAGMNGRTTMFDDPIKGCRNGLDGLDYELQSHKPLDLVVIMLGTNDLKHTNAEGSAKGMELLVQKVLSANERFSLSSPVFSEKASILLVSPVQVINTSADDFLKWDAHAESAKLAALYEQIADRCHLEFFDASKVACPSSIDGIHLGREGHLAIGNALAELIH